MAFAGQAKSGLGSRGTPDNAEPDYPDNENIGDLLEFSGMVSGFMNSTGSADVLGDGWVSVIIHRPGTTDVG